MTDPAVACDRCEGTGVLKSAAERCGHTVRYLPDGRVVCPWCDGCGYHALLAAVIPQIGEPAVLTCVASGMDALDVMAALRTWSPDDIETVGGPAVGAALIAHVSPTEARKMVAEPDGSRRLAVLAALGADGAH